MNAYQKYSVENQLASWTRIDMLIALYDQAISKVSAAEKASQLGHAGVLGERLIEANRLLLALHGGLNTDKYPMAVDIARLLNFVMYRLEQRNFSEAVHFLEKLKCSYELIRDEANALEKQGKFATLDSPSGLNTVA